MFAARRQPVNFGSLPVGRVRGVTLTAAFLRFAKRGGTLIRWLLTQPPSTGTGALATSGIKASGDRARPKEAGARIGAIRRMAAMVRRRNPT